MASDERGLIVRCQAGDQAAFRELVSRYQRRVYGIAFGMVRDADDAMDLTQEAFIKVHRNLHRFRGGSSLYTWMYRIVVNLCIDHLRRRRRGPAAEYDDTRAHEGAAAPELLPNTLDMDPDLALRRRRIREAMDEALQTLSADHRAVILLREVEGLSYSDMAAALSCKKGTVMSRLFHARRNLQRALREQLEGQVDLPAPAEAEMADEHGFAAMNQRRVMDGAK